MEGGAGESKGKRDSARQSRRARAMQEGEEVKEGRREEHRIVAPVSALFLGHERCSRKALAEQRRAE